MISSGLPAGEEGQEGRATEKCRWAENQRTWQGRCQNATHHPAGILRGPQQFKKWAWTSCHELMRAFSAAIVLAGEKEMGRAVSSNTDCCCTLCLLQFCSPHRPSTGFYGE